MSQKEKNDSVSRIKSPSIQRAKEVDQHTPYQKLQTLLSRQEQAEKTTQVIHWFRSQDLRIHDNKALYAASQKAKDTNTPLVCLYTYCEETLKQHGISPARTYFNLTALQNVKEQLEARSIPLVFLRSKANQEVDTILRFLKEHSVSHLYANYEYEFDELNRDIQILEKHKDLCFSLHHDQTVVEPGTLLNDAKQPIKQFTTYYHTWLKTVAQNPNVLDTFPVPSKNTVSIQKIFPKMPGVTLDNLGSSKLFPSDQEREALEKRWPANHDAGITRMNAFLKKHVQKYHETRSEPALDSTSRMNPYFSAGLVSVREVLHLIKQHNNHQNDFSDTKSGAGIAAWVRELVFRELYRQKLVITPHLAMNLPENLRFTNVRWKEDQVGWEKWCQGKTGVPFVDAGMRQLNEEAFMHNRLRMNVASYLYGTLLIDYRKGERYFSEKLIDWDLSNNAHGWQPSYTIFNQVSQGEKCDPNGEYIRRWVPELKEVKGRAIFDPYHRLPKEDFEKLGYPKPHVDWSESKTEAIKRFKEGASKL